MKRILLVCGSGICTSTAVNQKVTKALEERGLKGQFQITQGKASEVAEKSKQYDFYNSTWRRMSLSINYRNSIPAWKRN